MITIFHQIRLLASCFIASILVHFLFIYGLRLFGTYDFSVPVNTPPGVMVSLDNPALATSTAVTTKDQTSKIQDSGNEEPSKEDQNPPKGEAKDSTSLPIHDQLLPEPEQAKIPDGTEDISPAAESVSTLVPVTSNDSCRPLNVNQQTLPLKSGKEFLTSRYEKLTYQITMFGIPIGIAELEAKNDMDETSIILRVRSNAATSSFFPVDNIIESRHIDGRFIMTKIKQQEGSFRSDEMFTINLPRKRVAFIDNLGGRSLKITIPSDDVLDTLSGIYYLRNRYLQVGKTETLHIFDSETYAEVPVEILRRETIRLPNLKEVTTLIVRPLQQTAGIFRRTGDILIWITDDEYKIPVRIVTSIALGQVTADLVSSESTPWQEEAHDN